MIRIGTCSWKYDFGDGIIYPDKNKFNYLEEYSKYYNKYGRLNNIAVIVRYFSNRKTDVYINNLYKASASLTILKHQ